MKPVHVLETTGRVAASQAKHFLPPAHTPATADFMPPPQYPNKLIPGGANYYEHMLKDTKMPDFRKENAIPVFFLKAPTTSLVGCGKISAAGSRFGAEFQPSSRSDWRRSSRKIDYYHLDFVFLQCVRLSSKEAGRRSCLGFGGICSRCLSLRSPP
jgi:hypothetical protein